MSTIWQMTAHEIAQAVRDRKLSAREVAQAHLDRLDDVNPLINAVVQDNRDDTLQAADEVDGMLQRGEDPGPLAGVPVTTKVNVDQKGHATTNGLRLLKDLVAEHDSPVVSNLRKAGAVIVGRTNTPAFSLRWFTKNALHGQTLNPRNKGITPGGSSGGAAASVAAGLCAVGHGTDIAGSIRYPAYACGLHGLRPTHGRVPAYNATAPDRFIGAQLMAVSGPIARSIADIELAFAAMSAADARDPWYVPAKLTSDAMPKRAAVTFAPDGMPVSEHVRATLQQAVDILSADGWEIDERPCPPMRQAAEINAHLWMAETQLAATDLMQKEAEPDALFVYGEMSRMVGDVTLESLMRALQTRAALVREWELFLQDYPLFICPVSGELPFDQQLDVSSSDAFARVYEAQLTQRGLPTIGVPGLSVALGSVEGRPTGVQLVAGRFREDLLIAVGRTLEEATSAPTVADPEWS